MTSRRKRNPATKGRSRGTGAARERQLRIRLRLYSGDEIALGPGKADLLTAIHESGSITQAAQQLDMSYMRAWNLVRTMNRCFTSPLVVTERGGASGGRAHLTPAGREILTLYRAMTAEGLRAAAPNWRKLRQRLRA